MNGLYICTPGNVKVKKRKLSYVLNKSLACSMDIFVVASNRNPKNEVHVDVNDKKHLYE